MKASKIWSISGIIVWIAVLVLFGTGVYINWYLPHGPMVDTGDVVCQNDDMGPCSEKYIEDTRNLNIPDWAKFFRTSEAELLLIALALAGVVISSRPEGGYRNTKN